MNHFLAVRTLDHRFRALGEVLSRLVKSDECAATLQRAVARPTQTGLDVLLIFRVGDDAALKWAVFPATANGQGISVLVQDLEHLFRSCGRLAGRTD